MPQVQRAFSSLLHNQRIDTSACVVAELVGFPGFAVDESTHHEEAKSGAAMYLGQKSFSKSVKQSERH